MIKYLTFLNEAKKLEGLKEGDYVICERNFRGVTYAIHKLAIIEKILKKDGVNYYKLRFQKPDKPESEIDKIEYCVYSQDSNKKVKLTDTITLSKGQSTGLAKISMEAALEYKKGNLINLECTKIMWNILKSMNIKIEQSYIDICFVDIDKEKNDIISFVPLSKYKTEIKNKIYPKPFDASFRQIMKIGKFLKKILPSSTDKDIESLVASFKNNYDVIVKKAAEKLRVVVGEDIRKWYNGSMYGKDDNGNTGTLGNSCMRYTRSQKRFNIYCENPDKCAMLIYTNDRMELMARALIWKLDDGKVYLDRIYFVDAPSYNMLKKYEIENKMLSYDSDRTKNMSVTLKKDYGKPNNNPYMDTFRYFDTKNYVLMNPSYLENVMRKNNYYSEFSTYNDHD